jgi:hypothetical protein
MAHDFAKGHHDQARRPVAVVASAFYDDRMERLAWLHSPPVVVWEKTGQWATWWRGVKPSPGLVAPPKLIETRSSVECRAELDRHPMAFAAVELSTTNLAAVLDLLAEQERRWPSATIVVLAERSMHRCELIVREAGALGWSTSPRLLRPIVDMACRHVTLHARPYETLNEAIHASLPWRVNSTD